MKLMWNADEAWQAAMLKALAGREGELLKKAGTPETSSSDSERSTAQVIASHPALSEVSPKEGPWVLFSGSSGYSSATTSDLIERLSRHVLEAARRADIYEAVRRADEFLTRSAAKTLPGYDLTFVSGIALSERLSVAPGLSVLPFRMLSQLLGSTSVREFGPLLEGAGVTVPSGIAVVLDEVQWGPAIESTKGKNLTDPWSVEWKACYGLSPDLMAAMLTITLQCPLRAIAAARSGGWVDQFLDSLGGGGTYWPAARPRAWPSTSKPLSETEEVFVGWNAVRESDRSTLALAAMRLGASHGREGPLAAQDRTLDVAIALELLYALDPGELTYKLSTRAAWYLGANSSQRLEIRKLVTDFYRERSKLVHGKSTTRENREPGPTAIAIEGVSELAWNTLRKHIANGGIPRKEDWPKIVLGA